MHNEPRFPHFIVGGAPKCGTSSLYFWLSAHPEICASKIKEPYFMSSRIDKFNKTLNRVEHGMESYSKLFTHCAKGAKLFEASAGYLYLRSALDGFLALPEPPKMIFVLRNPSSQFYSHFRMQKYRLNNPNVTSLGEYFGRENVSYLWKYSESLKMWLGEYDRDKLKVVIFENLVNDKVGHMRDIANFLEVDGTFYDDFVFDHRNESLSIRSSRLHKIGLKAQPYIPHRVQKWLLPLYLKANSSDINRIEQNELAFLKSVDKEFQRERNNLKELLPTLDLTHWS